MIGTVHVYAIPNKIISWNQKRVICVIQLIHDSL